MKNNWQEVIKEMWEVNRGKGEDVFTLTEFIKVIEQEIEEQRNKFFTDEGANSMCEYWYQIGRKEVLEEVEKLIIAEMNIANKKGQPTSRLTSLINKLK